MRWENCCWNHSGGKGGSFFKSSFKHGLGAGSRGGCKELEVSKHIPSSASKITRLGFVCSRGQGIGDRQPCNQRGYRKVWHARDQRDRAKNHGNTRVLRLGSQQDVLLPSDPECFRRLARIFCTGQYQNSWRLWGGNSPSRETKPVAKEGTKVLVSDIATHSPVWTYLVKIVEKTVSQAPRPEINAASFSPLPSGSDRLPPKCKEDHRKPCW